VQCAGMGWDGRETAMVSVIDKLAIARLGPHRFFSSGLSREVLCLPG